MQQGFLGSGAEDVARHGAGLLAPYLRGNTSVVSPKKTPVREDEYQLAKQQLPKSGARDGGEANASVGPEELPLAHQSDQVQDDFWCRRPKLLEVRELLAEAAPPQGWADKKKRLDELRRVERASGLATAAGAYGLPSWLCHDKVGEELAERLRREKAALKAALRSEASRKRHQLAGTVQPEGAGT